MLACALAFLSGAVFFAPIMRTAALEPAGSEWPEAVLLTPKRVRSATSSAPKPIVAAGQVTGWDLAEDTVLELKFESEDIGEYELWLQYLPLEGTGNEPELGLSVNGSKGNQSLDSIALKRAWVNDGEPIVDSNGNEIRPRQAELAQTMWQVIQDPLENAPSLYSLSKGLNTVTITALREDLLLAAVKLVPAGRLPDYKTYRKQYPQKRHNGYLHVEAENANRKSDATLYAVADKSSPSNSPCDPQKLLLNAIGGTNWRYTRQWIEWDIEAPDDGYYTITMRLKQNERLGQNASRKLYIDGEIPYKELNEFAIPYNSGWQHYTVSQGGTDYAVYLTRGKHTLRLENTIGEVGNVLRKTKTLIQELNQLYRSILIYIGNSPDADRDYKLHVLIPDLANTFQALVDKIQTIKKELLEITGDAGEDYAQFEDVERQLQLFLKNENKIPAQYDLFRTNISSLSEWLLRVQEQPVLLDYIELSPAGKPVKRSEAGFFKHLWFDIRAFLASFFTDYHLLTGDAKANETVTIWIGSGAINAAGAVAAGRDQANAAKSVVDSYFTPSSGISINIKLVDANSLIPAVATGNGPDMTMFLGSKNVMDYGFRGALLDLSTFADVEAALKDINAQAASPFAYQGKRYALPDSYSFSLLFYRRDILGQLGLKAPETWDDADKILPELNNNYLTIGLPSLSLESIELFTTILYQSGGSAYNKSGTKSLFSSAEGIRAFEKWGNFYTRFDVPQKLDLLTYFRTGQAPLIIAPYTFYNNLAAGAPEIDGLWGAAPVPGTIKENGRIDHSVMGTSTGAVIFANSKRQNAAWEFLKWWTGETAQYRYGIEVETTLGAAGRIATANEKAFQRLPWSGDAYAVIRKQMTVSKALPEVPGGYMSARYIPTAMRLVVNNGIYPRDALILYTQQIDEEIKTKRNEFRMKD